MHVVSGLWSLVSLPLSLSHSLSVCGAGLQAMQACGLGSPGGPLSALVAQLARSRVSSSAAGLGCIFVGRDGIGWWPGKRETNNGVGVSQPRSVSNQGRPGGSHTVTGRAANMEQYARYHVTRSMGSLEGGGGIARPVQPSPSSSSS